MALTLDPSVLAPPVLVDQGTGGLSPWLVTLSGAAPFPALRNSYIAHVVNVTPAVNAFLLSVQNNSLTLRVRVWRADVYISAETAVAGVLLQPRLTRSLVPGALSGGIAVTPSNMDPIITLNAAITVRALHTAIGVFDEFRRALLSGDEAVVTTLDADALSAEELPRIPFWQAEPPTFTPITLPPWDGVGNRWVCSIQNLLGAVGNVGVALWFTTE